LSDEYELLRQAMPRVRPSPEFRSRLQARLAREARHERAPVQVLQPVDHTRDAVLAAAAVLVAGLAFFVWHRRGVGTRE
jgi:anti-sigma-K factor RskA